MKETQSVAWPVLYRSLCSFAPATRHMSDKPLALFLSAAVFVLAIEKSGQPHGLPLSVSRAKADSALIACKSCIAEKCPRLRLHGQQ